MIRNVSVCKDPDMTQVGDVAVRGCDSQKTTVFIRISGRSQVRRPRRGNADHYKHCRFLRFANAAVRVMIVVIAEVMDFAVVFFAISRRDVGDRNAGEWTSPTFF